MLLGIVEVAGCMFGPCLYLEIQGRFVFNDRFLFTDESRCSLDSLVL